MTNQHQIPILQLLESFQENDPVSFHVPGHKNGTIFPAEARSYFDSILPLDVTELPGLDDLHAPHGVIAEAERLAAEYFRSDHTFFLVGGSTAGNLAMVLATCVSGDKVIVQRNCHKSIMNGLELSGAIPIFLAPAYDETVDRYTAPDFSTLKEALDIHPDAKAVVLTYPDYFGKTYPIKEMIEAAHAYNVPVLVDEAHGVHFSLKAPKFPPSALELGADVVVQSAHKMAPAMTMGSYLHVKSQIIAKERIAHFLQILQSSSPSYPLMASLDIARNFLATMTPEKINTILASVNRLRELMQSLHCAQVLPPSEQDDPLKLTLHMKQGFSGQNIAGIFEKEGIYPELAAHNQILFIHGLAPFKQLEKVGGVVQRINEQLKMMPKHDTIETTDIFTPSIGELALTYPEMQRCETKQVSYNQAQGYVAAEAIIPYPPGIPLLLKGERITAKHVELMEQLTSQGVTIQTRNKNNQLSVFHEGVEHT